MIDINELRRLAQAATPHVGHACKYQDAHWLREGHVDFENADLFIASERPQEDAAFYAAANPAAVSELLDRLEAAESDAAHQKALAASALRVAKGWERKCGELRAKIAEMERQEPVALVKWQPIETAPRNQAFLAVLNCAGEQTICTMRWPVAEAKNSRTDNKTFHVERVTHWMPLPELPGAQPAPSLASDDVSLISEGKTQPAQSVKDAIIDDLQSQFDSDGITEHDSGDALIRLSDAIAAVEDNFAQPAPIEQDTSVRKAWARFSNELHRSPNAPHPGMSEAFEQHFSQSFTDREWRAESATWAAAWKAAKRHEAQAQPAPSVPDGWLRAIDEALIVAHIGMANADDTYAQAKSKLDTLIGLHVDVATDPAVNGGWKLVPVEILDRFPEINQNNYNHDDVCNLNAWGVELVLAAAPETKP